MSPIFVRSSKYRDFGQISALCIHSPIHKSWSVHDLMRLFMPPIMLNQYRVFRASDYPDQFGDQHQPVGFITWALMNDEGVAAYTQKLRKLQPSDFAAGDQVWVIDLVAPFGGTREIVRDMRKYLSDRYPQQKAHWIRNSQTPHRRLGFGARRD